MTDTVKNKISIAKRCTPVSRNVGLTKARKVLRELFSWLGLKNEMKQAEALTILDELGNNILRHSQGGKICITVYQEGEKKAVRMVAEDRGTGISDLAEAMTPGFSQDKGMGMGLNLLNALADDLRVASLIDGGTRVEVWKWI